MKFFRGEVAGEPERETDDSAAVSAAARLLMRLSDGDLAGFWKLPEGEMDAMKEMDRRVLQREPMYGTGENRRNGFDPDMDEAIFEALRGLLLDPIEDDSKKPTVRTKLLEVPPGLFGKRTEFRVELRVAKVDEEGRRIEWGEPHYTEARPRKADLVPLLADLLDTKVPSVRLNE